MVGGMLAPGIDSYQLSYQMYEDWPCKNATRQEGIMSVMSVIPNEPSPSLQMESTVNLPQLHQMQHGEERTLRLLPAAEGVLFERNVKTLLAASC